MPQAGSTDVLGHKKAETEDYTVPAMLNLLSPVAGPKLQEFHFAVTNVVYRANDLEIISVCELVDDFTFFANVLDGLQDVQFGHLDREVFVLELRSPASSVSCSTARPIGPVTEAMLPRPVSPAASLPIRSMVAFTAPQLV